MRKTILNVSLILGISIAVTSCYTYTYTVGSGPQTGVQVKEKNHYVIGGLAKVKTSDPTKMAGESKNYEVKITHTFIDGLISGLTAGIYTPTTTIVTK